MTLLRPIVLSLVLAATALAFPSDVHPRQSVCATPSTIPGYNQTALPDPFILNNGAPITTRAEWACRRQQIASLIQGYEAGYLPPRPPVVEAIFTKTGTTGNLTVTAGLTTEQQVSFSQNITYPSIAAPAAGYPLLIAYDFLAIPVPSGIAVMTYANSDMAVQNNVSSRGQGIFYDLYGSNATASAMTAWAWGVSRIIDALELAPEANINPNAIAVTGCSRDGKGALMAGAFEERVALTIPQESGSGGDTCWRLSKYEQDSGDVVQQATEIVTENVWLSTSFDNYVYNISELPYDHHSLAGLIAPRGMISYENTELEWLSPLSGYGCMTAAHTIWEALGVSENHGFVQVGDHPHCEFPTALNQSLFAFFDKFLLGETNVNTSYFSTNGQFNGTAWVPQQWINWTAPALA
ncbi:carbohydrate esterase family 15 protein [Neolentinus lepideus HHB14362 ss-1]|uniref:(4-O-methyl)-D-glucuronate--lignin esterase n=1 Tax=Neolentinus lepideus HHB14362 ss-1 TaxID=1314782 RepID=A0A165VH06_9AGAM|nr:carbohydrate esterase family 15 protein [Neolentinus lepideus HHB14362 ss-1]